MKLAKYWARASAISYRYKNEPETVNCYGWSSLSTEDAKRDAQQRADKVALLMERNFTNIAGPYGYYDRPMREQILEEISNHDGKIIAALTRTNNGCVVLNSENMMFVDIDFPPEEPKPGFFARLMGKKNHEDVSVLPRNIVHEFALRNPQLSMRLYSTRAGLRVLFTHAPYEATSNYTETLMKELCADPLYIKLCRLQQCFRARLTPKPHRMSFTAPEVKWPWDSLKIQAQFSQWLAEYNKLCESFATCRFERQYGAEAVHPEFVSLIALHDDKTRANSTLPLA